MKLLLDTHAVLWWFADDPALRRQTEALIGTIPPTPYSSAPRRRGKSARRCASGSCRPVWGCVTTRGLYRAPSLHAVGQLDRARSPCRPLARAPQGSLRPHAGSAGPGGGRTGGHERPRICGAWGQGRLVGMHVKRCASQRNVWPLAWLSRRGANPRPKGMAVAEGNLQTEPGLQAGWH